jgi:hypothetical protein
VATPAIASGDQPKVTTDSAKLLGGAATVKTADRPAAEKAYKGRDFDAEAKGKVACAAFVAALQSPGLAQVGFSDVKGFLKLVEEAADAAVAYTWKHQDNA